MAGRQHLAAVSHSRTWIAQALCNSGRRLARQSQVFQHQFDAAERTWHIPAWLDRALPRLNIEGTVLPSDTVDGRSPTGPPTLPGSAPHPRAGVATEGAEG